MSQPYEITARHWLMVLILGVTWGSSFLLIELALPGIGPAWLAASRIVLAAALMGVVQFFRRAPLFHSRPSRPALALLILLGLLNSALPFGFLTWGQQYVTSAFAGVSMSIVPLLVLPLAHLLVPGERMTLRRSIGFVIGFVGTVILVGGQALESSGAALEPWGRAACLGTATCYAIGSILLRRLPPFDPVNLAAILLVIGAIVMVPYAWIIEGPLPRLSGETLFWVALLGLFHTAAANVLRVLVIRQAGPVFMSITNYIVPVCSVLMGWAILSEPLPPSLIWALILILAGVGLSQYGALKRLFNR